jgi:uncharacterized delta-60 repeat protein
VGSRTRALAGATVVACALLATASASAAPGDLDTSFGRGAGFVNLDFGALIPNGAGTADSAEAVAVQPDGRIVLAGTTIAAGTYDMAVLRLTGAGVIDTSYGLGTGGSRIDYAALIPGATLSTDSALAVALQPDGKIVVGGYSNAAGNADMTIVRLNNPQGTLDSSYGLGTAASRIDLSGPSWPSSGESVRDIAIQPDGRILVAGESYSGGNQDHAVARVLSPQGTFDSSFAGTGLARFDFAGLVPGAAGPFDAANGVALQRDGKIVLGGVTDGPTSPDMSVLRLTPTGTIDSSYGLGTGGSRIDIGAYVAGGQSRRDIATGVGIQPDGKIVVAGYSEAAGPTDFAAARVRSPQGTIDPSFGADGKGAALVDLGGTDEGRAMAIQANGKIVIAGYTNRYGNYDAAVVRLQPNGTLDTTFGNGGLRIIELPGAQSIGSLAIAPDGGIVIAGRADPGNMFVARLLGDPPSLGGGPSGGGGGKSKVLRCQGKRATVIGTNKRNRLKGTRRADVIVSLGGNDSIDGKGGNDLICAGDGNDKVSGGDGNDRVYAGNGNDTVSGGNGKDRVAGQNGKDKLRGGPGNDSLDGGSGNDKLYGQAGKDTLLGRTGKDALAGGPGTDKQKQ